MSKLSRKYQKLTDVQDKTPSKEPEIALGECLVCGKVVVDGFYGAWGTGGVCSKTCNTAQSLKPKYPAPHDEQSFLERVCEDMDNDH